MSLEDFLRLGLFGAATGALYALVGLGIVVGYRASGVLNFAAGAAGGVGAYTCYWLRDDIEAHWLLALAAGITAGAALGTTTQVLVVRLPRNGSPVVKLIASLGMMSVVLGAVPIVWGTDYRGQPESMLPTNLVRVLPNIDIPLERVILIAMAVVLAIVLRAFYSRSLFGLATAAVAENRRTAATGGLSATTIELANFTIGGGLSAAAAILLAPTVGLEISALTLIVIPAMAAALVGRFSSFALTVAGATGIGVMQAVLPVTNFVRSHPHLTGLPSAVPVLVIIAVTTLRGTGRLGRDDANIRLPLPGTGQLRFGVVAVGCTGSLLLMSGVDDAWLARLHLTLGFAVVLLSVLVATGLGGQLSLSQYALAGFGCWVAARLVSAWDVPLPAAGAAAVASTVLLGLVVALPALRTRGVELAVATLGLAQMIFILVLNNSDLTGGIAGTRIDGLTIFGIDIDPLRHAEAYGAAALACFVASAVLVANLRRGRAGRRLLAVRSNERAAAALGVGVYGAKLYAFAVAAGLAAVGGIVLGFRNRQVVFLQFDVFGSIAAIQNSVIGGLGYVGGAAIGALVAPGGAVTKVVDTFVAADRWVPVFAGAAVILTVARHPDGLAASLASGRFTGRRPPVDPGKSGASPNRDAGTAPLPRRRPPRLDSDDTSLVVSEVTVRFGGVVALDAVSFSVAPAEILGIIGPNGAGKTTLLDVVTGFTRAQAGHVSYGGETIDGWSPERRARAGICRSFQGVELFDEMSVRENLLVAADDQRRGRYASDLVRPGAQRPTDLMVELVDDLGLGPVLDRRPNELDQGTRRLVGIARTLCAEPIVAFLDEPAAGLSTEATQQLAQLLRSVAIRHRIAVVLVEHDVPLVMRLCDRVVVLDFGRKIADDVPKRVRKDPAVVTAYLGGTPEGPRRTVPVDAEHA